MLYAKGTGQAFSRVTEALREIGVSGQALDILPEYFDLEKERNNALLKDIREQCLYNPKWELREKLNKAIKKEIDRVNSEELYMRWMIFTKVVGGTYSNSIGFWAINVSYPDIRNLAEKALTDYYGKEEMPAILHAAEITSEAQGTGYYRFRTNNTHPTPEVCMKAAGYTPDWLAKLVLATQTLDSLTPPEQKTGLKAIFSGKKQETLVQQALDLIREAEAHKADFDARFYYVALAEAANFDKAFFAKFSAMQNVFIEVIAETAMNLNIDKDRILDQIDALGTTSQKYIEFLAHCQTELNNYNWSRALPNRDIHLARMAEKFPQIYQQQMIAEEIPAFALLMEDILAKVNPDYANNLKFSMKERTRERAVKSISFQNEKHENAIRDFLTGKTSTADFVQNTLPQLSPMTNYYRAEHVGYIDAYGLDDFAERCICFHAMINPMTEYPMIRVPGFRLNNRTSMNKKATNVEIFVPMLRKHDVPVQHIVNACGRLTQDAFYSEDGKQTALQTFAKDCAAFADEVAAVPVKTISAEGRCLYVRILGEAKTYTDQLFALTDDGSKAVRALLCKYLPHPGSSYDAQILDLLQAKKGAKREIAITLLEQKFPENFREAVQQAFEKEKTAALQARLAGLLGETVPEAAAAETSEDLVTTLTKGNKAKKVAWLFKDPFREIRTVDGQPAENLLLQALLLCYANAEPLGRNAAADQLAQRLNAAELEGFAQEVFARWVNEGAPAKNKWVLYLTAIHGGLEAVTALLHYIKDWAEHSRGAIASEAVYALAMNGSSSALMAVDNMARKFKNRQVRSAAGHALQNAADALGITREELADKIVPDLGFDENLCRVFDFGTRQFKVYLTPALELEIFEGEKRLKNLPKPGTKDDPEIAAASVKEFKEMKKQMKAAIQSQKQRLEYVLLCDRKWTADGWRELFIRKPVMHCFAIGLIWGVYEENKLVQSFRYMEDGSFNTADEDEYELPENAVIGLVHPMELDAELLAQWQEQLQDYEIAQPFPQLSRPVYRLTPEEENAKAIQRFSGKELPNMTLLGKMTKLGWDKGYAQDAGMFNEFRRTDLMKQEKLSDGTLRKFGYEAELQFSGMYIASSYDYDLEDVTIEKVIFRLPGANEKDILELHEVNPRYLSEIIAQLTSVLGDDALPEED